MNAAAIAKALDILLSGIGLLRTLGVNYSEVIAAQEAAEAEGRELTDAERQRFIDEAQSAIDQL